MRDTVVPRGARRARASTWDRSGGNDDAITVPAGSTVVLAEDTGPGRITHIWSTALAPDLYWGRSLILRAFWDGEDTPSIEVPFGDFFGAGNCVAGEFAAASLSIAPRDARSYHSWFEMPYGDGFRLEVENQSSLPILALYVHVDYERWPEQPDRARFHAWWNRSGRTPHTDPPGLYRPAPHPTTEGNHLLLAADGPGRYMGAFLYVHSTDGGWYGEGDEMILIDDEGWPPTLHGTGTEDWAGTAWGPAEPFSHPSYGQPVADREDWAGFSHLYRFHAADPIPFSRSIHASIERGHANDRRDDLSSVAYWYQEDRTTPLPPLPPRTDRMPPWPPRARHAAAHVSEVFARALADPGSLDGRALARYGAAASYIAHLAYERDWLRIQRVCSWLDGRPIAAMEEEAPAPRIPELLARARDATAEEAEAILAGASVDELADSIVETWIARFDRDEAEGMNLGIGFRFTGDPPVERGLVVRDGICEIRDLGDIARRIELSGDPIVLARFTLGLLDPWEAFLSGALTIDGDTSMAFRFGIFGVPTP